MHKVYLKPGKEESLKRFHPWIFSGAISRFDGEPEEGEVVEVYTSKKEFIAEGQLFYFYKRKNLTTIPFTAQTMNRETYIFPMPDNEYEFGNIK